tara:strand:+ start:637 stop:1515 length:879 start_codon:yes stop_codon:yes gene_type:complete
MSEKEEKKKSLLERADSLLDLFRLQKQEVNKPLSLKKDIQTKTFADLEKIYGKGNVPDSIMRGQNFSLDIGEGNELLKRNNQTGVIAPKDRPRNLKRVFAGLGDLIFNEPFTSVVDLDKQSGEKIKLDRDLTQQLGIPIPEDKSKILLSPLQSKKAKEKIVEDFPENVDKSAVPDASYADQALDFIRKVDDYELKKGRRTALETLALNVPSQFMNQYFANRAGEISQERLIRGAFQLEALPSNIQALSLSKQQQQAIPALAEAELLKAVAQQQEAANKFGLGGIQRTFGSIA